MTHPVPYLGRPQTARPPPGPRLSHGSRPQHDHRDAAPRRLAPARRGSPRAGVAALRARHAQCPVANGFQGYFPVATGRCHPLTVLDDCSRFALCLQACPHEQGLTVQAHLTQTFRRYGLPARMLMDNGPPWGTPTLSPFTPLTVWLLRLGIALSHARPAHPQTLGKDERFHRTLKTALLHQRIFRDLAHCQQAFARWRDHYNLDRPHDALALAVPATRYTPSPRPFPEALPPIDYGSSAPVRRVQEKGTISFRGRRFRVTKALRGYPVALRPTTQEGRWRVYFCHQYIRELDLNQPAE